MKDKKLNNLIEFKEFKLDKLENKPGKKVVENLTHIEAFDKFDENIFTDVKKGLGFKSSDEKFKEAEKRILAHPVKSRLYNKLKREDSDKAKKYVEFFVKNPEGYPKWNGEEWLDTAKYSHELGADIGAPSGGY